MNTNEINLVAGSTGLLGGEVCRLLRAQGSAVRALARESSDPTKIAGLTENGVEVARGDLKDRGSLDKACRGVSVVISTASSTVSRQAGDSIESVDLQGQLNLIEAAEAAGVRQFVLVSFPGIDVEFPLQTAKRAAEERLRQSQMAWTILQPTCFMEVWLGPALGFAPAQGAVQIFGDGKAKTSWISFMDVARFTVAALGNPRTRNAAIKLGGPDALSPLEVVRLAEQLMGRTIQVQHVPVEALRAQHAAATDSLQKSFAALMLYCARGDVIEMAETQRLLPVKPLRSVREHLKASA